MKKLNFLHLFLIIFTLNSCKNINQNFEVSNLNSNFIFLDSYQAKGPNFSGKSKWIKHYRETGQKDNSLLEHKIYKDARFFDLVFNLKNNTGEKLEEASIITIINIYYKSNSISYSFPKRQHHYKHEKLWEINEIKKIDTRYIFNDLENYDSMIFEHKPEKITLNIYVYALNSIGFDNNESGELIYNDEVLLNDWK